VKNKSFNQIKNMKNSFVTSDEIEIGLGKLLDELFISLYFLNNGTLKFLQKMNRKN